MEYKGAHLIDSADTKEKSAIGALWEEKTKGRGLFLIAEMNKGGLTVDGQLNNKIGK